MIHYIIPARKGSKGLPGKNKKLFNYTYDTIPKEILGNVIVTSDDIDIINMSAACRHILREDNISTDDASIKSVLLDVVKKFELPDDDVICMLYLTYPGRTWDDIQKAIDYFYIEQAESLLCRKEVITHPFMCIYNDGSQVIEHNLYRRQDYPETFEICHYIQICYVSELKKLNNNLYNRSTVYYPIDNVIDIDEEKDLLKWMK